MNKLFWMGDEECTFIKVCPQNSKFVYVVFSHSGRLANVPVSELDYKKSLPRYHGIVWVS